jgi:hypothetical protein
MLAMFPYALVSFVFLTLDLVSAQSVQRPFAEINPAQFDNHLDEPGMNVEAW